MKRALFALAVCAGIYLLSLALLMFSTSSAQGAPAITCGHHPTANVTVYDYNGPFTLTFCAYAFQYTGATITLAGGDPHQDGIFRNGFDSLN